MKSLDPNPIFEGEEEESNQICDGDLITYDDEHFYVVGKHSCFDVRLHRNCVICAGIDDTREDIWKQVDAYCETVKYWPNVWKMSDHGNLDIYSRG
jgi:hypothetical protein